MGSRQLLNLVLLAVVLALAWLTLRGPGDKAQPGLPVTGLEPAAIQRITVQRAGHPDVVLHRAGEGWRIAAPLDTAADTFRVQGLLGLASARSQSGFRAAGNDLAQYGLEPPQALVGFDTVQVAVGDSEPVSGLRYVLSEDQVHLLEDPWFAQIFGQAEAWVDPHPLPAHARPVRIDLPDARWQLQDGRWQRTPADASLSGDAGPELAEAWRRARALAVRALDPAQAWDGAVQLALDGGATLRFELARTTDSVLLANRELGVQYRFLPRQGLVLLGER